MMLAVLANRTYRHLFSAQVIALVGTGLLTVALGLLAFQLAGRETGAGLGTALAIFGAIEVDLCLLYQRPRWVTHGDSHHRFELIPWRGEDSRHVCCGEASDGLFGLGSPPLGGGLEARQPQPPPVVFGSDCRWHGPGTRCADRWDGSADAARLGSSVQ